MAESLSAQRVLLVHVTTDDSNNDFVITNIRYFRDALSYAAFIAGDVTKGFPLQVSFSATPSVIAAGSSGDLTVEFGEVPPPPSVLKVRISHVA